MRAGIAKLKSTELPNRELIKTLEDLLASLEIEWRRPTLH